MPIVLDCNIVRGLGEGEIDSSGLLDASREGFTIHLADGAVAELVNQLLQNRFRWPKWVRARGILRRLLNSAEPIMLGGRQGLHRAGVVLPDLVSAVRSDEITATLEIMRAGWTLLANARCPSDLVARGIRVNGFRVLFDFKAIRREIKSFTTGWGDTFDRTFHRILDLHPNIQTQIPLRGDALSWLSETSRLIGDDLNRSALGVVPPVSVRLDAMIRVFTLLGLRRLRAREPYNPQKHRSDSFDYDLLRYLAYPAVLCTNDRGIASDLDAAGSWQRKWVVQPDSLGNLNLRTQLRLLEWPSDSAVGTASLAPR